MNATRFPLDRCLRLTACCLALGLLSNAAQASCSFASGSYMTYERDVGTFWVPRDAPVGTVIGRSAIDANSNEGASINCFWNDLDPPTANLPNTAPLFAGNLPPVDGKSVDGHVMQSNVPGVGAYFEFFEPFDGSADNTFRPDNGRPAIPYTGRMTALTIFNLPISRIYGRVWLIKTGPIPPGPQRINGEMFHGSIHHLGKVLEYRLGATVNQAQCSSSAVSADPVQLGNYKTDDFTGTGFTTAPIPFHITLMNCEDATAPNPTPASVYIELDGTDGSVPTVASDGRFSLTSASSAEGVEIQLLRADGRPMPLRSDERVSALAVSVTRLDFHARYYQSAPVVKPGLANGALTFIVSYK